VRLNDETIGDLPQAVATFAYDRAGQAVGIVHFGIGAFHRAHQAWYTDAAMSGGDRDWMILGVSLRSAAVADQMNPQDGLYTVTKRSGEEWSSRLIGSVKEVLVPTTSAARLAINLAAPRTQIISFTVTEKGYCPQADGSLDLALAGQGSFYPLAGTGVPRPARCGDRRTDSALLRQSGRQWRAVAAADDGLSSGGSARSARLVRHPSHLPILHGRPHRARHDGGGSRPGWERHGAQMVESVEPYETAKLRMLNGAHSALAYLRLERGHALVHQAVRDPAPLSSPRWAAGCATSARVATCRTIPYRTGWCNWAR
jgi:fructuronate reductase